MTWIINKESNILVSTYRQAAEDLLATEKAVDSELKVVTWVGDQGSRMVRSGISMQHPHEANE